ncbi:Signal recognition particle subunit SRP72 [Eumeta japonica]|uniref:Signal recognition particle subunit SRP72 n=1 Tax=Eumeta variegata TaxID=151549 RepID=A0A4C1YPK4_EUMVA|nr:Signal recognition particle subunit SRP72 [Eumeta japonica]
MANKDNNLVQAYIELNKFCQNGDYDRALKASVLQIAPNEQKAFHCKVVCFIQLHNFKEALSILCNPKNASLANDLYFEKAYVQYRLNCPKDALQTVDNAPELTPVLKELRAQILYRLEQYQECYSLYRDIVKNTTDEYEDERKANMAAVVSNMAALNPFDENTYELTYNAGSTLAMKGKYGDALPVLKRAEQKCSESVIDDGGTEEEAKEEAAIIR